MTGQSRLLQVEMIPDSLWETGKGYLLLPHFLADTFREAIMTHRLSRPEEIQTSDDTAQQDVLERSPSKHVDEPACRRRT